MGDLAPVMNMFEQPPKVKPFKIKMPSINRHSINPDSERKLAIRTHDQSPSNDQGKSTIEKNEELQQQQEEIIKALKLLDTDASHM